MVVARPAVTVVARAKDSAARTEGYRGDDGGGNKDNSKSNSGENGERQQRRRRLSSQSYFLFFGWAHDKVTRFVFWLNT